MGHFFSKVSLFIDKKEAAAHLILDQDFATAPYEFGYELLGVRNSQSVSVIRPRSEIAKVIPLNYSGLVIFGGFNLESIVVEILSFS